MGIERFESLWDAIEETPSEAETMRFRSALLMAVRDRIAELGLTRNEAAKRLGVTQGRVSELMQGRVDSFGSERLLELVGLADLRAGEGKEARIGTCGRLIGDGG